MIMIRYRNLLLLFTGLIMGGCAGRRNGGQVDDSKLQYTPEVNEVTVTTLVRAPFSMQILANGKLSATQKSSLYFKESGQIVSLDCSNGTFVHKGAVLARLDDSGQKAMLETARIEMERARIEYLDILAGQGYQLADTASVPEDVRALAGIRSGYSKALNSYSVARSNLLSTVLTAPFSGRIADLRLKRWDRTDAGPFCTLIADDSFDVTFQALEHEYPFIRKGQKVSVSMYGPADYALSGTISSINPKVDKNGQIDVTATIPGDSGMLDGMNVKVTVEKTLPDQFAVPKSAVVIRDNLEVVFRYNNGRSEWVYVRVLNENSAYYAIEANTDRGAELHAGDEIIISGNLNLADGSNVIKR